MSSTRTAAARQPRAAAALPQAPRPGLALVQPVPAAVEGQGRALARPPAETAAAAADFAGCARLQAATAREIRLFATDLASEATDLHTRALATRLARQKQRAAIAGVGVGILRLLGPQPAADDAPALAVARPTIFPRSVPCCL